MSNVCQLFPCLIVLVPQLNSCAIQETKSYIVGTIIKITEITVITIVAKRSLTKKTKKSLVFSVPRKIKRYSKDHGNKITNAVVYARPFQNPIFRYGLSFFSVSSFKFYT